MSGASKACQQLAKHVISPAAGTLQRLLRQYLYFCTSKASKVDLRIVFVSLAVSGLIAGAVPALRGFRATRIPVALILVVAEPPLPRT